MELRKKIKKILKTTKFILFKRKNNHHFCIFVSGHIFQTPEAINLLLEPGIW